MNAVDLLGTRDVRDTRPRIAEVTILHNGLLVEWRSGLVIFYRDGILLQRVRGWPFCLPTPVVVSARPQLKAQSTRH